MTKSRAISLALALGLLALLLLTQSWFDISMAPNQSVVNLGSFDGATTYPVALPLALFSLASLLVATISAKKMQLIAILLGLIGVVVSMVLTIPALAARNISALDQQLARLTGIANSHGITDLTIDSTYAGFAWVVVQTLLVFWLTLCAYWQPRWIKTDRSKYQSPVKKNAKDETSAIGLWDSQRS